MNTPVPVTVTSKDTVIIERSGPLKANSVATPMNKDAASDNTPAIPNEIQPIDKPKRQR
jgi:hypothetical protein